MKSKNDFNTISDWTEYIGNYAEARFLEECAKKGYTVLSTMSVRPYDFVIERYSKSFERIQIKALSKVNSCQFRFRARGTSLSHKIYKNDSFDHLAMYLVEYDRFYYVPAEIMIDKLNDGVYIVDSELETRKFKKSFDVKNYKNW